MDAAFFIARPAIGLPIRQQSQFCASRPVNLPLLHRIPSGVQLPFKEVQYRCPLGTTTMTKAMTTEPAMALIPPVRRRARLWRIFNGWLAASGVCLRQAYEPFDSHAHRFRRASMIIHRIRQSILCLALLVVAVCTGSTALNAQSTTQGAISGSVLDTSGAAIPGAKITITNSATNATITLVADASGFFKAPLLEPGTYTVS